MNKVAMIVAGCCAMSILTGCGVKEEIHQGVVDQLAAANMQIETLSEKLADETSKLNSEKAKMRTTAMLVDKYETDMVALQKVDIEKDKAIAETEMVIKSLEAALIGAEEQTMAEVAKRNEVEDKNVELLEEYEKLLEKYNQYKKNMSSLPAASTTAPAANVEQPAAAANPQDLMDLLNEMSM